MAVNTRRIITNAGCSIKNNAGCYLLSIIEEFIRIVRVRITEWIDQTVRIRRI
jgi:hypothetical protein